MTRKRTDLDVIELIKAQGPGITDKQIVETLEDGAALAALGLTDDDQTAIEGAHAVISHRMREALEAVADGFSDGEIIDGVHIGATIEFAGKQFKAISYPSDGKLSDGATGSEVDALCEDMIEDALNHIEADA